MEPAKLILLAIAAIGVILLALLFYLLVIIPRGRRAQKPSAPAPHPGFGGAVPPFEDLPKQPLTHIPGMDSVHQHGESDSSSARERVRTSDLTPPSGIPRSELRDLLTDTGARPDDRTPAGGMPPLGAPRRPAASDLDTAPQAPLRSAEPPRKRTVALHSRFLEEEDGGAGPSLAAPKPRTLAAPTPQAPPAIGRPSPITGLAEPTRSQATPTPVSGTATHRPFPIRPVEAPPAAVDPAPQAPPLTPIKETITPVAPPADPFGIQDLFSADESLFQAPEMDEDTRTEQVLPHEILPIRFRDRGQPVGARVDALQQLLAQTEPDEQILLLVEAINDEEMEVQLIALREITPDTANSMLDEVIPLVESPSADVALHAVKALESIGGPVVEQAILVALESPHAPVRAHASNVLVKHATEDLEEQLHEMLNESDGSRVEIAAQLLARIGGPQNAEVLDVRVSLTPATDPLYEVLQKSAAAARSIDRSQAQASSSDDNFGEAETVSFGTDDMEEFELSLDPELFNPKS